MNDLTKKVYLVSVGHYSDKRVIAVFDSMDLAKEFMTAVPGKDYNEYNEVEIFELNPKAADMVSQGYGLWNVYMLRNGDTEKIEQISTEPENFENEGYHIWKRSKAFKGTSDVLISTVWAKNAEHAIKIVNEHRLFMIANGEWD